MRLLLGVAIVGSAIVLGAVSAFAFRDRIAAFNGALAVCSVLASGQARGHLDAQKTKCVIDAVVAAPEVDAQSRGIADASRWACKYLTP